MEHRHNCRLSRDDCTNILHSVAILSDIIEREGRPLPVISAMINGFKCVSKNEFRPLIKVSNYVGTDRREKPR